MQEEQDLDSLLLLAQAEVEAQQNQAYHPLPHIQNSVYSFPLGAGNQKSCLKVFRVFAFHVEVAEAQLQLKRARADARACKAACLTPFQNLVALAILILSGFKANLAAKYMQSARRRRKISLPSPLVVDEEYIENLYLETSLPVLVQSEEPDTAFMLKVHSKAATFVASAETYSMVLAANTSDGEAPSSSSVLQFYIQRCKALGASSAVAALERCVHNSACPRWSGSRWAKDWVRQWRKTWGVRFGRLPVVPPIESEELRLKATCQNFRLSKIFF